MQYTLQMPTLQMPTLQMHVREPPKKAARGCKGGELMLEAASCCNYDAQLRLPALHTHALANTFACFGMSHCIIIFL